MIDVLAPENLIATVLLGLVVLYWLGVIIGALDLDLFDFDLDPGDVDVDADVEIDIDADAGAPAAPAVGLAVLRFFHVGSMPLMVLVSFLALSQWTITILGNHWIGPGLVTGLLLMIPYFLVSLFVTKLCTLPLRRMFRELEKEQGTVDATGQRCVIKTSRADSSSGQAEVKTHGAPLLLNVRTREGEELERGTEAVVVEYDKDSQTYLIARL